MNGDIESVIDRVVRGDARAWHTLWNAVQPTLWAVAGRPAISGPLARSDDDKHNVVLLVMDKLRADDFRRLRLYLESVRDRRGPSSFRSWLATVTARVAIDYVRAHPEFADTRDRGVGERWVRIVPMNEARAEAVTMDPDRVAMAGRALESARGSLRSDQLAALFLWLQGEDHGVIADRLHLASASEADRLVRSALKRLRDRLRHNAEAMTGSIDKETLA